MWFNRKPAGGRDASLVFVFARLSFCRLVTHQEVFPISRRPVSCDPGALNATNKRLIDDRSYRFEHDREKGESEPAGLDRGPTGTRRLLPVETVPVLLISGL